MAPDFSKVSAEEAIKILSTTRDGLSFGEAKRRLNKYGPNILSEGKKVSWYKIFFSQFRSPLVIILIFATLISFFLGEIIDAIAILIILILNAILGTIQEYKAENAIESLKKLTSLKATVIRSGKRIVIDASQLVPGDIIIIEEGMLVPADIRILECHGIAANEAVLTGESVPVTKDVQPVNTHILAEKKCMLFRGASIIRGYGLGVVTATGHNTELGKIAKNIGEMKFVKTHLETKLSQFAKALGILTIFIAFFVFILYSFIDKNQLLQSFMLAISLAVAAIPEGLPAVVTLCLSFGAKKMAKKNVIMRRLSSIETLGAITVICTDKTGTLTKNELTVTKIYDGIDDINVSGVGYTPIGNFSRKPNEKLLVTAVLSSNASLEKVNGKYIPIGDPTEVALITLAMKAGLDINGIRGSLKKIGEASFSSERKRMTVAYSSGNKTILYTKGAPEVIIDRCSHIELDGKVLELSEEIKQRFLQKVEEYTKNALRVLALGYKEINRKIEEKEIVDLEKDFILLGIVGMLDPPREEVKKAIQDCKRAGIKVVMITGDHINTARAIAKELGITGKAILGKDIEKIDLDKEVEDITIYARLNPDHKLKIVEALKKKGHIVAMTGDGVNDAPAIKKADIGIAVGSGTDVAKEAAEMIILDDNFATIVKAIEEGRGIYRNIKKFINYLLSANMGEVIAITFAGILAVIFPKYFGAVMLTALQLLWINLITDGLPALGLGLDPTPKSVMDAPPRDSKEPIIDRKMKLSILFTGILLALATLFSFATEMPYVEKARTMALTTLVLLELARIASIKASYGESPFNNKYLIYALLSTIFLQLIVIYSPIRIILGLVPLGFFEWIEIIGLVLVVFLLLSGLSPFFSRSRIHSLS